MNISNSCKMPTMASVFCFFFPIVSDSCVSTDARLLGSRKKVLELFRPRHTTLGINFCHWAQTAEERVMVQEFHRRSFGWCPRLLRCPLKETVPLLILDAERTSSQLAIGGAPTGEQNLTGALTLMCNPKKKPLQSKSSWMPWRRTTQQ